MTTSGTITERNQTERFKANIYTFPLLDTEGEYEVVGVSQDENSPTRFKKLIRQINEHFGIKGFELYQKTKGKVAVSFPRQVAMYMLVNYFDYHVSEVAEIINRDRSTVISAVRVISGYMSLPFCDEKKKVAEFLIKYQYA